MPKVELPESSAADSFLAEIRERKQAKEKKVVAKTEEAFTEVEKPVEDKSTKKPEKKKVSNRLVIPKPTPKESKGETITFIITKSLKRQFQEKCERESVTQNYILEQLIEIWVQSEE